MELILTKAGDFTLYNSEFDEHYHSTNGAIDEALHVYINNGLKYCTKKEIAILEVGFGTGLNAFLTAMYAEENKLNINYFGLEKFPVNTNTLSKLGYENKFSNKKELWEKISKASWESDVEISDYFNLYKHKTDLIDFSTNAQYDLIYFDAFAPDKQAEMWTEEIMQQMANILLPNGILSSYTAKGIVKQALRKAGLTVKRLKGAAGKRHMIIAKKNN